MTFHQKIITAFTVLCAFIITQAFAAGIPAQSVLTQTLAPHIKKTIKLSDKSYHITLERLTPDTWRAVRDDGLEHTFEVKRALHDELPAECQVFFDKKHLDLFNNSATPPVVLIDNNRVAGYYAYSFDPESSLYVLSSIAIVPRWRGSGAADILLEDFAERVLKGNRHLRFEATVTRNKKRSSQDPGRSNRLFNISEFKKALGIISTVTYDPHQAYKEYKEMSRKDARAYVKDVKRYLPKNDKRFIGDIYKQPWIGSDEGFILYNKERDAHYFILDAVVRKKGAGIKAERLAYALANALNAASGKNILPLVEQHTVSIDAIESERLKQLAKKKGLTHITLTRVASDYISDESLKNPTSIEALVAFYVMTRDWDHVFAGKNSFWISEQKTNISYDHDRAFDANMDEIIDFMYGNPPRKSFIEPLPASCTFKGIFDPVYYLSDNHARVLNDLMGNDIAWLSTYEKYSFNYQALKEYAQFMSDPKNLSDRLIKECVMNAGYTGKETEEISAYVIQWRNDLIPDLEKVIGLTHRKPFSFDPAVAEEKIILSA
jgi:hypothetical protein